MANAFSPDGDGINDEIGASVYGNIDAITNYQLEIRDRFGIKVFASSDINQKWNGMYNGKTLPAETYVYRLELQTGLNEIYKATGNFLLTKF